MAALDELTTEAPAEPPSRGLGPGRALVGVGRRLWRWLTSMRTALILLFLLALAAIPGSLLPQRNLNIDKVNQYLSQHPTLGPLLDHYAKVIEGRDDGRSTWRELQALNQLGVTRGTLQMA